ncbi:MAG TPA: hemerythrin domain-containing protein [Streptosporangiaceae bacterium]|nr:hemerythrin domain-containing protein [Streptosporangiaceae bacterium]
MADAFDVLRADHAAVEQMLAALETSPGHSAGAGSTVLAARKEVAQRLVIDSSKHEAAEEQYFWPIVRKEVADGDQLADQAIAQEQEAKEVLARLDKLSSDNDEFDQLIGEFIPAARAHIEFEETRVWPALRDAISAAEAQELGTKLSQAKEHGPTRPHPHTPASPGVLKTAGPAVAAVDKLRDAVAGRGQSS